ncbi:MAG: hypothetical protein AB4057_05860 [Crocosphaera sp.]
MPNWPTPELTVSGKIGIGTDTPSTELDVIGSISATNLTLTGNLQLGALSVREFSDDGNLADNSSLAIPTERAVKSYVDREITPINNALNTKAFRNGAVDQDFTTQNLSVRGDLKVSGILQVDTDLAGRLAPPVAFASHTQNHITSLGNHVRVKLNVRKGDIVEVMMHGSAGGQFYYDIDCQPATSVQKLTPGTVGIIMTEEPWHTIASNGLFEATKDGTLEFSTIFFKRDVSGVLTVFNLHLVAKVLLNKS